MNKRAAQYLPLFLLFMVLMAVPILYWRLSVKMDETKKAVSEDQLILLSAPYDKEDTINYAEKAAQLSMPEILGAMALANGYSTPPCGGTLDSTGKKCAIVNTGTNICRPSITDTLSGYFNLYVDNYIKEFNAKSFTKLPTNNYEVYIEGNNIHAIAILPVTKSLTIKGTELDAIGTMWFAPSFTIQYKHKLDDYKKAFDALTILANDCFKHANPAKCVSDNSHLTTGWTTTSSGNNFIFEIPIGPNKACYALSLPSA